MLASTDSNCTCDSRFSTQEVYLTLIYWNLDLDLDRSKSFFSRDLQSKKSPLSKVNHNGSVAIFPDRIQFLLYAQEMRCLENLWTVMYVATFVCKT